ncbi:MAG: rhomboid family intramembrane serine protease [Chitinophagaceae bacterium]
MGILTEHTRPLLKFSLGDNHNMAIRLVVANLVIFTALLFVKVVFLVGNHPKGLFESQIIPWAVLSSNPDTVLSRPWTVITYMFVHISFWNLLSSVIWMWWFGELLQGISGYRRVVPVYVYGGLAGAFFFILAYTLIPDLHQYQSIANTVDIGAAASVMALIICVTVVAPKYRVFPMLGGGIPIYVIAIIYVGLSFLGQRGGSPYGYIAAQTGGALLGLVFALRLKNGYDPGAGFNRALYFIGHLLDPADDRLKPVRVKGFKGKKAERKMDPPYKRIGPVSTSKVDDILDKINETGYRSLTSEEKEILQRASREGEVD